MLSLILPAHDEEVLLGRTLDVLRASAEEVTAASGEPFELVVVDDASTDGTAGVADAHGARVVRVEHRRIAAARNAGAEVARGDRFVFVDADTLVPPETLAAAVAALDAGAVGGGCAVRLDGEVPLYGRVAAAAIVRSFRTLGWAAGCFVFCTRAAFGAAGGFDEQLSAGEEVAFSRALKRHGRFVVLRESVLTSGRKLRTHSKREVLGGLAVAGLRMTLPPRLRPLLDRASGGAAENPAVWYGGRREDRIR